MNLRAVAALIAWALLFAVTAAYATEPTDQDLEVACLDGVLSIEVGDHVIGMTSYRLDGDDGTWEHIDIADGAGRVDVGNAKEVTVWIELDGLEVDPKVSCRRTTTTTYPTTTSSTTPTTAPSSTTTTRNAPPPTSTTSSSVVPATSTTRPSPPLTLACPVCATTTTSSSSTTTTVATPEPRPTDAPADTCTTASPVVPCPVCACLCPTSSPAEPATSSPAEPATISFTLNLSGWADWIGANGLLALAGAGLYMLRRRASAD